MEEKKYYAEVIKAFVQDYSKISCWFYNKINSPSYQEIQRMYEVIKTMWFDYREVFPNKGTYKTVRRLFIKCTVEYFSFEMSALGRLSQDFMLEIVYKARQGWFSDIVMVDLRDYLERSARYERDSEEQKFMQLLVAELNR
ncbi:MAG: hypothetical protein IKL33_00180 [Alphaproteobacteria bacterium]|nr:hypothetical protein [Alphaproteobacteria bacterium]